MSVLRRLFLAAALLTPAISPAEPGAVAPTAPLPSEHRLSDTEVERTLDAAAKKREATEQVEGASGRRVHGEMGVAIGTGGYRSAYGTAVIPVADSGVAIISFDATDFGKQRGYFGPAWR